MSETFEVRVPDIGTAEAVDVVEVLVEKGTRVEPEQGLVTLESDKASMELPSPKAGVVESVAVAVGDKVKKGTLVAVLTLEEAAATSASDGAGGEPEPEGAGEAVGGSGSGGGGEAPRAAPEAAKKAGPAPPGAAIDAQLLVLGAGVGGYTAAFRAADLGLKVVLVERYASLGGVCLNVGCIPSKALLHAAKVIDEAAAFAEHGIAFGEPRIDLDKLRGWKDQVVGRLTGGVGQMARARKVRVVTGTGRFVGPHEMVVETGDGLQHLRFEHALIAAGSQAAKLNFLPYDDPRVMDSTDALELAEVPERLLVIGGGIIGLELAAVYHALGSRITVVEVLDGLMPGVDRDLVRRFQRFVEPRYENLYTSTRVTAVEAREDGLHVTLEGKKAPEVDRFDRILVAVGRRPNGKTIGADAAGVQVDDRGFVRVVDKQMRTSVPHIFAVGDIIGNPMLAHKSGHQAKTVAEVVAGERSAFDARAIPSVAYTDPEIAWVGVTEDDAKRDGVEVEKGLFPWAASGRSLALGRDEGLTKLLFDKGTGRVVGAGIVGPGAGDLISEVTLAIEMGCDAEDIGLTIHPHPTLSETVAFAAEAYAGTVTDILPPRKR